MLFAFSHSKFPLSPTAGQAIASLTSLKIRIPISKATAAPIKERMNPSERTINQVFPIGLFKI